MRNAQDQKPVRPRNRATSQSSVRASPKTVRTFALSVKGAKNCPTLGARPGITDPSAPLRP